MEINALTRSHRAAAALLGAILSVPFAPRPALADDVALAKGARVERDLAAGGADTFAAELGAGHLLRLAAEQRGADLAVSVEGAGGATLVDVDDMPATSGAETVVFVAPAAGRYRVRVRGAAGSPAGGYTLAADGFGPATPEEAEAAEAARLVFEAQTATAKGDGKAALAAAERALSLREKRFGAGSIEASRAQQALGGAAEAAGDAARAEAAYRKALEVGERAAGADAPELARPLSSLAILAYGRSDLSAASALGERALSVAERAYGAAHTAVADALTNLAAIYLAAADFEKAEARQLRAIELYERALGPEAPELANALNTLAVLYDTRERHDKSEPIHERALKIREKRLGPDHPETANSLFNLAFVYKAHADYARATALHERALAIREKALGPDHADVAASLDALATLARTMADYAKAEQYYARALAAAERAYGPEHPKVGQIHSNIATLYSARGDFDAAERTYKRAIEILEKGVGRDHPFVSTIWMNYGEVLRKAGREAEAVAALERAAAALEAKLGPESLTLAHTLDELGIALTRRDPARAGALLERALRIREKAAGPETHPVAASLAAIGVLERSLRDFDGARAAFTRMLAITESHFGDSHPDVGTAYAYLSELAWATGDAAKAVEYRVRSNDARERDLVRNLPAGSERQKLLYLDYSARDLAETISLQLRGAPDDEAARRMALEAVLRRKGRALDAMSRTAETLRRRGTDEDRALLDRLAQARARLSAATLAGPGRRASEEHRRDLDELQRLAGELEARAGARFSEFRATTLPISAGAVRAEIPAGAALVEIASYFPYDVKTETFGARRYALYVAAREGAIGAADLGAADEIDALAGSLRDALRARRNDRGLARRLDERVMRPARRLAGSARHLLVSPDGALNLVPLAALVDETGRRLVERYTLTYLTSGRDLLRLSVRTSAAGAPLVVAAPDFGGAPAADATRSVRLRPSAGPADHPGAVGLYFPALPGTAAEARAVASTLPGARLVTGLRATKRALLDARGPVVLHVATHGFFLSDAAEAAERDTRRVRLLNSASPGAEPDARAAFAALDPLVRSGLALAGANEGEAGDAVLTALEAASLDLWGTRLAVLSACDTGVGEVRSGEGVFGLRRALVLAGSESQIMSLWPVSDSGTRELMTAYYRALRTGRGRSEALRDVQLAMLRDPKRRAPYYWASFIQSGDWRPLADR